MNSTVFSIKHYIPSLSCNQTSVKAEDFHIRSELSAETSQESNELSSRSIYPECHPVCLTVVIWPRTRISKNNLPERTIGMNKPKAMAIAKPFIVNLLFSSRKVGSSFEHRWATRHQSVKSTVFPQPE